MLKQLTPIILITAIAACSSPLERRQINGNDNYTNTEQEDNALIIPKGLDTPHYNREFTVPHIGEQATHDLLGKNLDIRPPLQVMPFVQNAQQIKQSDDAINMVIEANDNKNDVKHELFSNILQFLKAKKIGVSHENYHVGVIYTDWIETSQVIESHVFGKDNVFTSKLRYEFDIQPHQSHKYADLTIKLVQYEQQFDGNKQELDLIANDKKRHTIDIANDVLSYINSQKKLLVSSPNDKLVTSGIHLILLTDNNSHWLANADFNRTWEKLLIVLPEMGFSISDMNREQHLFFVNYQDNSSFWDSLWGSAKSTLPLKYGEYSLRLEKDKLTNKTRIYLQDKEGNELPKQTISSINPLFTKFMLKTENV